MKLIRLLFLLFPILTFSQTSDKKIAEYYQTKNSEIAIFPKDAEKLLISDSRFTPTKEDIEKAENALRENLKTINQGLINQDGTKYNPVIHKNLRKYRRQYFGYIDEDGDRVLLINAIWSKIQPFQNWLSERITVLDGGSHYWNVKFNLTTGEFFDLSVNGTS